MHVKGPEILNMWVGESERMVRDIFATAREKRREGFSRFCSSTKRKALSGRGALRGIEHSVHARADVLLGDGRDRFVRRSRDHSRLQPRGSD